MDASTKRAHEDENSPNFVNEEDQLNPAKRICLSETLHQPLINPSLLIKNSLSILNEIKQVQPIKFETISKEGPSHEPFFKISLKFTLKQLEQEFFGTGNSIKRARLHASVSALVYLTKTPEFFTPFQLVSHHSSILNDLKSLNIEASEFFGIKTKALSQTDNQTNNITNNNTNKEEEIKAYTSETSSLATKSIEISVTVEANKEKKVELNPAQVQAKVEQAKKTQIIVDGYLNANNLPSLFNYLVPNEFCFYSLKSEIGTDNSKTFETELRVKKDFPENSRNILYRIQPARVVDKNNALIKEVDDELVFLGLGKSKTASKVNAIRVAIEFLFSINLEKNGNLVI
jgi:hypothetical protein